jgi:hypothetical protein
MGNVYLVKKNGGVIAHADLQAMKQLEGVEKPDMTITLAEFESAGGLVRLINNEIIVGKTPAEKEGDEKQAEIAECNAELAEIDREAGAGRTVRSLVLEMAQSYGLSGTDYDRLAKLEGRAETARESIRKLRQP